MGFEKGNTLGRKFQPGNPGGPGRPPLTRELREIKAKANKDAAEFYLKLREKALAGDVGAIRLGLHLAGALKLDEAPVDDEGATTPRAEEPVEKVRERVLSVVRGEK